MGERFSEGFDRVILASFAFCENGMIIARCHGSLQVDPAPMHGPHDGRFPFLALGRREDQQFLGHLGAFVRVVGKQNLEIRILDGFGGLAKSSLAILEDLEEVVYGIGCRLHIRYSIRRSPSVPLHLGTIARPLLPSRSRCEHHFDAVLFLLVEDLVTVGSLSQREPVRNNVIEADAVLFEP